MRVIYRVLARTSAFLIKEAIVALGQPRLIASVIVGPFLLLFLFGLGFTGTRPPFNVLLVVPNRQDIPKTTQFYSQFFFWQFHLTGVTTDQQAALAELRRRRIDVVIVAPSDPLASLAKNEPAVFHVYDNNLDPIDRARVESLAYGHTQELNKQIVATILQGVLQASGVRPPTGSQSQATQPPQTSQAAIDQLRQQLQSGNSSGAITSIDRMLAAAAILGIAGSRATAGGAQAQSTPAAGQPSQQTTQAVLQALRSEVSQQPGVTAQEQSQLDQLTSQAQTDPNLLAAAANATPQRLAAPVDYTITDVAPSSVSYVHFYAPVVLVLLLQHVAITLGALSVVRERTRGTVELFIVAPVRLGEILVGKALSFGALLGALAAILVVLLFAGIRIPFLGNPAQAAGILALLIALGLAIGFIIAAFSRTETQAVQLAMLVLLISVFFGGLFVPITTLSFPIRGIAYAVPVTPAGAAMQEVMLRGNTNLFPYFVWLGILLLILGPLAALLMHRTYRAR